MGLIKNDPILLEKGLRAEFLKSFNNAENPADVMDFITETQSTSNKEGYGWLGNVPQLVEWTDERKLKGLMSFDYEIQNKAYEATLQVDRDMIEDDQLGAIKIRIQDLASRAKTHPRKLFFTALINGTSDLCYDGQAFFSASHSEGSSGTQSNIVTGTGTTLAQLQADIESAVAKMKGFKDDQGEPWYEGDIKIAIVCPLALEWKFKQLNSLELVNNSSNALKGQIAKVVSSGRFSDANDWYIANINPGLQAFIKQNRRAPEFASSEKGDRAFMSKMIAYGIDYRVGFGYGYWQKMCKVTNT